MTKRKQDTSPIASSAPHVFVPMPGHTQGLCARCGEDKYAGAGHWRKG